MTECTCPQCCYARKHPQLGPAPHKPMTIERERFMRVVSMSEAEAKAFGMPDAAKVVYAGQADSKRYKFGARVYYLFPTRFDYEAWLREGGKNVLDQELGRVGAEDAQGDRS